MGLLILYCHCTEERIPLLDLDEQGQTEALCLLSDRAERLGDGISLAARCESQVNCFHIGTPDKLVFRMLFLFSVPCFLPS